jgi:hypothetical protein
VLNSGSKYSTGDVVRRLQQVIPGTDSSVCRMLWYYREHGAVISISGPQQGSGCPTVWSEYDLERLVAIWKFRKAFGAVGLQLSLDIVKDIWVNYHPVLYEIGFALQNGEMRVILGEKTFRAVS